MSVVHRRAPIFYICDQTFLHQNRDKMNASIFTYESMKKLMKLSAFYFWKKLFIYFYKKIFF
ncbi:hypothetical protein CN608_16150 [Bacillus pseudomycoides]|nr:hypothetical protein CN608_16150 [Bacillus pseudomycoides]